MAKNKDSEISFDTKISTIKATVPREQASSIFLISILVASSIISAYINNETSQSLAYTLIGISFLAIIWVAYNYNSTDVLLDSLRQAQRIEQNISSLKGIEDSIRTSKIKKRMLRNLISSYEKSYFIALHLDNLELANALKEKIEELKKERNSIEIPSGY